MKSNNIFGVSQIKNQIIPCIPYMGSKRKIATYLLNEIYQTVGDFDHFYDLFGGGGAMSIAALTGGHSVFYNEKNTGVANLMKYIINGGVLPKYWISREEFEKHKNGDEWYSGFIKCIWSFGNNQRTYIYGKDIENLKYLLHQIVVDKNKSVIKDLSELLNIKLPFFDNMTDFKKNIRSYAKRLDLESLERLQRLERLQSLEMLQSLKISNNSYNEVEILPNSIIYCDPPYFNTSKYQECINYDLFYEWCLKNENPVFISSYKMPSEFKEIFYKVHTQSLSATTRTKVKEKLFWNNKYIKKQKLF